MLYTIYPIVARAWPSSAFRPNARVSKCILHTIENDKSSNKPVKIIKNASISLTQSLHNTLIT